MEIQKTISVVTMEGEQTTQEANNLMTLIGFFKTPDDGNALGPDRKAA